MPCLLSKLRDTGQFHREQEVQDLPLTRRKLAKGLDGAYIAHSRDSAKRVERRAYASPGEQADA
jgi:hypothetical protein